MKSKTIKLFTGLPLRIRSPFLKIWYEYISKLDQSGLLLFMNYGYAPLDGGPKELTLDENDELHRYPLQLYNRVAGAVDLKGKTVLEVGSGRGGGANFVARYLKPDHITGVDITENAVAFCNRFYKQPNLSFRQGDAQNLDFEDESFDAIINVESSHCYVQIEKFFGEVKRTLKPGGHFLYTDWRDEDQLPLLYEQLKATGLEAIEEEDVTANVLKALDLDNARKENLINKYIPSFLKTSADEFSGMQGSHSFYEAFQTGDRKYLRFVLKK